MAVVLALLTVWTVGYQSDCEAELARFQQLARVPAYSKEPRSATTFPTTKPVAAPEDDRDECP
jgi:hypothetical protein